MEKSPRIHPNSPAELSSGSASINTTSISAASINAADPIANQVHLEFARYFEMRAKVRLHPRSRTRETLRREATLHVRDNNRMITAAASDRPSDKMHPDLNASPTLMH